MNRISDITRHDIEELVVEGTDCSDDGVSSRLKINYFGRVDEITHPV